MQSNKHQQDRNEPRGSAPVYRPPAHPLRRAWSEYLQQSHWDHFVTLTFEHPVSEWEARREFEQRWHRRVSWAAQCRVHYAYVVESGPGGRLHVHALVSGTAALTTSQLERAWKAGHSRVEVYDETEGGASYVAKSVSTNPDAVELSAHRFPARASLENAG